MWIAFDGFYDQTCHFFFVKYISHWNTVKNHMCLALLYTIKLSGGERSAAQERS